MIVKQWLQQVANEVWQAEAQKTFGLQHRATRLAQLSQRVRISCNSCAVHVYASTRKTHSLRGSWHGKQRMSCPPPKKLSKQCLFKALKSSLTTSCTTYALCMNLAWMVSFGSVARNNMSSRTSCGWEAKRQSQQKPLFFCSSLDSIFCLQSMFSARLKLPKRFMKICGRKLRKTKKTLRCDVKTEVYEVSTSMIKWRARLRHW